MACTLLLFGSIFAKRITGGTDRIESGLPTMTFSVSFRLATRMKSLRGIFLFGWNLAQLPFAVQA